MIPEKPTYTIHSQWNRKQNFKMIRAALLSFNDRDRNTKIIFLYNGRRYELGLLSICEGYPNYQPLEYETLKLIMESVATWRYKDIFGSVSPGLNREWVIAALRAVPDDLGGILKVNTIDERGFEKDGCYARNCLRVAGQWRQINDND